MVNFLFQHKRKDSRSSLWSARVRLDGWLKARTFPLHVTDKRVAQQKLAELVVDLEREAAGIGAPRIQRKAAQSPLKEHLKTFLADCKANGCSANTLTKYGQTLPRLCDQCRWVTVRDIGDESFLAWRRKSDLSPKTVNDCLSNMRVFLNWMKRRRLIAANPLEHVQKVHNDSPGNFRRALSVDEINRLLAVAKAHRAAVYQTILYTGLRRNEINGLRWSDFDFSATPAQLKVPSSLAKNRKASTHYLRPELTDTLARFRPEGAKPGDYAFRGQVPTVTTLKRDLGKAGIPFEDERGRRIDLHALRTTFGTLLSASGGFAACGDGADAAQRPEADHEGLHRRLPAAADRGSGAIAVVHGAGPAGAGNSGPKHTNGHTRTGRFGASGVGRSRDRSGKPTRATRSVRRF